MRAADEELEGLKWPRLAHSCMITPEVVQAIQSDQLCLESNCLLNRNSAREVCVVLTNAYIALSEISTGKNGYQYFTPLDYDLKFELIYEQELTAPPSETSILSRVVGFTLQRTGTQPVEVVIVSDSLVEIWVKMLSRTLNQLGFHRLYKPVKKLGKGGFATVYE
ncbi:hypothetical protein DAPPUDRAFT_126101, partial [Daphnia pulex]